MFVTFIDNKDICVYEALNESIYNAREPLKFYLQYDKPIILNQMLKMPQKATDMFTPLYLSIHKFSED